MKKALFIMVVLAVSVFSTACINNLAVQELNNKAIEFMKAGDYENAISRLKSSVDLDDTKYETQYNLAVAYTENEDYEEAIEAFDKALNLISDPVSVYYSRAVMYENYAKDLFAGKTKKQKEAMEAADNEENTKASDITLDDVYKPTDEELSNVKKYYGLALNDYNKYLEIAPNSSDANDVQTKIQLIQSELQKLETGVDTN